MYNSGSEDAEVDVAAAIEATTVLEEELDQSVDRTDTQPTGDSPDRVADVTVDTPEE
jgi:hypothetical protein